MSHLKLSRLPGGEPEIFASIQGEGITAGLPSAFVRFSICNLRCTWCDTRYTWDWTNFDPKAEVLRLDDADVAARIHCLGVSNVVVTGGEPLLQLRGLEGLTARLKAWDHRVEIETNGTVVPTDELAAHVDQWNVSPKLTNSGNEASRRERPEALAWFAAQPAAFIKFVVAEPRDVDEVRTLACRYGIAAERILLMPEGRDAAALIERSTWIAALCQRHGFRFTTRLHVLLWGDERGR